MQAKPRDHIQNLDSLTKLIKSGNWPDVRASLEYEIISAEFNISAPQAQVNIERNGEIAWHFKKDAQIEFSIPEEIEKKVEWKESHVLFGAKESN